MSLEKYKIVEVHTTYKINAYNYKSQVFLFFGYILIFLPSEQNQK